MTRLFRHLVAMLALTLMFATDAGAQQPNSVNPTASSVKEQQLLDALKPSMGLSGRITIPDQRAGTLIQPAGQDFRTTHEVTLPRVGTIAILGMLGLLAVFYMMRGKIRVTEGLSGHTIQRFGSMERFAHWMTAVSFILLALSGLNLTFGKRLVLPLIGPEAFTWLTLMGKYIHNYVSFAFALGVLMMFLMWVKDNIPLPRDITWLKQGGGLIGTNHPAAGRFNGGQKLIFWSVVLGGAGLAFTGYNLMFPFQYETNVAGMQWMGVLHGFIAVIMTAIIIAHIYIGSVGMEGAFDAMGKGQVDVNWAKEHHSLWVEKVAMTNPDVITGPGQGHRRPQPAE
jgi:formate dehydrogenase subunit gamma